MMNNTMGMNESMIKDIVRAFSHSTISEVEEITEEYELFTGNFKGKASWDVIFKRIAIQARKHDLEVLTKKRGGLWTFVTVLEPNTGALLVFTKENNLDGIIKKIGSDRIHYFHALLSKHIGKYESKSSQVGLFNMFPGEYDIKRTIEAQKILEGDYSSVNQIVFIEGVPESGKMVRVKAKLFDGYFNLIEVVNLSSYISHDNYDDIFVSNKNNLEQEEEGTPVIPVVKEVIKNRKRQEEKIPSKKENKDKNETDKKI